MHHPLWTDAWSGQWKQATCHHRPLWTDGDSQWGQYFSTPPRHIDVWCYWIGIVLCSVTLHHQFIAHLELSAELFLKLIFFEFFDSTAFHVSDIVWQTISDIFSPLTTCRKATFIIDTLYTYIKKAGKAWCWILQSFAMCTLSCWIASLLKEQLCTLCTYLINSVVQLIW